MPLDVSADTKDFKLIVARMKRFGRGTERGLREEAVECAEMFRESIVEHASGRPGPERVTGRYTEGFTVDAVTRLFANEFSASVVTDEECWRRLEEGYTGTDALNRTYDQPPFPHIRPAIEETVPKCVDKVDRRITDLWESS